MSNKYRIPVDVEHRIRARDIRCVYCAKEFSADSRRDMPTIEHLNEKRPFHWHEGLKEEGLAICCGSCNSSRGNKSLPDWFRTPYCTDRPIPIGADSVAEPVEASLMPDPVQTYSELRPAPVCSTISALARRIHERFHYEDERS